MQRLTTGFHVQIITWSLGEFSSPLIFPWYGAGRVSIRSRKERHLASTGTLPPPPPWPNGLPRLQNGFLDLLALLSLTRTLVAAMRALDAYMKRDSPTPPEEAKLKRMSGAGVAWDQSEEMRVSLQKEMAKYVNLRKSEALSHWKRRVKGWHRTSGELIALWCTKISPVLMPNCYILHW